MIRFFFIFLAVAFFNFKESTAQGAPKIDSLIAIAKEYRSQNNFEEAIRSFEKVLAISEKSNDSANMARAYNYLATTYRRNNQKKQALQAFYQAIEINKAINRTGGLVFNYNNLANYYLDEGSYQLAYDYYRLAEILMLQTNDKKNLAQILLNMSAILANKNSGFYSYDSAVNYNLKALELFKELHDTLNLSFLYNNLGYLYEKNDNLTAAIPNYKKSLEMKKQIGDSSGLSITYLNLGNAYLEKEEYPQSIEYYEKSMALSNFVTADASHHLDILSNLVKAKMGIGKVEEASALFQKYNHLRDSLFDKEVMQEVKDIETKYETAKKEEEIRMQEMAIRQKTFQSNLFLGLSILLIVLVLSTIFFFLQKQEFVKRLKNEEIATMRREQELNELNAMMHGQEEERNRIANDLHDRLGARLSSIKLLLQSDDSREMKLKMLDSINEAIKETREISHNLSTDMLTRFGIETAIKDIVRSINDADKIQADFVSYGLNQRLPLEVERNIYHVVLELINNTLKHANANHLMIQVSYDEEEINIFYEDNGIGFDPQNAKNSGMGLRGIYARMNAVKGAVYVNSKPGDGTNVVLSISLKSGKIPMEQMKQQKTA